MLLPEICLIDGENIVARYQAMLAEGKRASSDVIHKKDVYVWSNGMSGKEVSDVRRIAYYTSATGDEDTINAIEQELHSITYKTRDANYLRTQHLIARVFKKPR